MGLVCAKGKGKVPSPLSPIPLPFSLPPHLPFDACCAGQPGPGCFNKDFKFEDWYDTSPFKPVRSTQPSSVWAWIVTIYKKFPESKRIVCEKSRFSSLYAAGDDSRGGTSATQRQKFHNDDVNQCLHNKSGSHGVPNVNLFNFTFWKSVVFVCERAPAKLEYFF